MASDEHVQRRVIFHILNRLLTVGLKRSVLHGGHSSATLVCPF